MGSVCPGYGPIMGDLESLLSWLGGRPSNRALRHVSRTTDYLRRARDANFVHVAGEMEPGDRRWMHP